MRNYNVYINGMQKANSEKLFFVDKVNLDDYNTIIDFGCGAGDVLHSLSLLCKCKLIGIDHDKYMRDITKSKTPNCETYDSLKREMLNEKTLIIFNSVLHEVESYWSVLQTILANTGATVVIRDMRFTLNPNETDGPLKNIIAKIVQKSNPNLLSDFINKYGMFYSNQVYHYLLKYTYVDNWELELQENYFSFNYDKLFNLGKIIYENNYTLEYKKQAIKKDFDIDIHNFTHTQIILRLNKGE